MDTNTVKAASSADPGQQPKRRLFPRSRVRDFALLLAVVTAFHATVHTLVAGACMVAVGLALQSWSKAVLRRNRELSASGPYSICRHPFYLGNFVFDLGLCVMSGNLWLVAAYPLLFWIGYRSTIRHEEALLRTLFGKAHVSFCQHTPRLLPNLFGLARRWRSSCSFQVMLKERQLSRGLRLLALPLLVVLGARTWHSVASFDSDTSLALAATALVLALLGHVAYRTLENSAIEPVPAVEPRRARAATASSL